ncbi:MAG: hypothetical protein ACOYNS_07765 [Bacteroidota bacterium]
MNPYERMEYPLRQPSRFVNTVSVISIFVSCYQIYDAVSTMYFMESLSDAGSLPVSEELIRSLSPSPAANYFEMFIAVMIIVGSVMMLKRYELGRKIYLWCLATASLWSVISAVRTYSAMSQYLNLPGMAEASASLVFLTAALTVGVNVYIAWKLTREEIKGEFH